MNGLERPRRRKIVIPPSTVRMLTVREIAETYGFHENSVRRWVTEDGLKSLSYGPGNKIFIAKKDVDKFIRQYYF